MNILYVEDDPYDADLTQRALRKSAPHMRLDVARTQSEALERLEGGFDYQLLLTDLRLPDGSGFSLLSHVRERNLPIAVVVITGQGDEEIAVSVLKAGADDYLVKRQDYLERLALTLEGAYQRYRDEIARQERPLRVLYLESDPADIDLTRQHFARHAHHIHLEIVHTPAEVLQRLTIGNARGEYDAILLDSGLHSLDALELLKELRQVYGYELPIVLVTGHGDEELAAQALRMGASDYVVKSPGYLFRLPGLLENAYHRAQLQREQALLRASEARFRRLARNAPDIIYRYRLEPEPALDYVSPAVQDITGFTPEELMADSQSGMARIHPQDRRMFLDAFAEGAARGEPVVVRMYRKDGGLIWVEGRNVPIYDKDGRLVAHEGIIRDITQRKLDEQHIQRQLQRLNALRKVDFAITGTLDLHERLDVLLDHVILQLGVHAAGVLLYNKTTQLLEYSAGKGFRSLVVKNMSLHLGQGHAGQAALQRRTIHIPDRDALGEAGGFSELLAEEGFVAYYGTPLIAQADLKGVLEVYHRDPLEPDAEWLSFFETLAGQAAIAIDNAWLFDNLQRAYDRTLKGWVKALDLRDEETQGHTRRVTEITLRLARAMGASEGDLRHIQRGALLHDIGKMAIPDSILLKPGPLTDEEWVIMRRHPLYAYELLSPIDYLRPALDIPYCHHEKWDGTGYPRQLKGEEIPLAARIFAVVDVWDALSNDRPYRKAWEQERVLEYLRSQSGTYFDPVILEMFLQLLSEGSEWLEDEENSYLVRNDRAVRIMLGAGFAAEEGS